MPPFAHSTLPGTASSTEDLQERRILEYDCVCMYVCEYVPYQVLTDFITYIIIITSFHS